MAKRTWETINEYEDILHEECEQVAKITLNRPEVYNVFRPKTVNEFISAEEAERMGIVNKVAPLEQLEDTVMKWCSTIKKQRPMAVRMIKRGLNAEMDQRGLMEFSGDATLMYYMMDEAQEGRNAFIEKRDPDFDKYPKFP